MALAMFRGRDGIGRSETVGEDGWSKRAKKQASSHRARRRLACTEAGFAPTFNLSDELTMILDALSSFAASFII